MIKQTDENLKDSFLKLCENDAFGVRTASFFNSYGTDFPFAQFWIQTDEDGAQSAISKTDGVITLTCAGMRGTDELSEFVSAVGFDSLLCSKKTADFLELNVGQSGYVMQYCGGKNIISPEKALYIDDSPPLKDIYDILKRDGTEILDFPVWYADLSHRIRHGGAKASSGNVSGKAVCCALIAQTPQSAVIGSVTVSEKFRNKGYGSELVSYITDRLFSENRKIFLLRDENENQAFYERLGFKNTDKWALCI